MDDQNSTKLKWIGAILNTYKSSAFRMQLRFRLERTLLTLVLDFFSLWASGNMLQNPAAILGSKRIRASKPDFLLLLLLLFGIPTVCSCQMQNKTVTTI